MRKSNKYFRMAYANRDLLLPLKMEESYVNIRKLKDKYLGQRGFVIGNGPSLRMTDLNMLVNEISIASNKIYLAYNKTAWRPTYYSIVDEIVFKNIENELRDIKSIKFFPESFARKEIIDDKTHFFTLLRDWYDVGHFEPGFSDNIESGLFAGECVTYCNIQILWYLGIREIYLLGVDHFFSIPEEKTKDKTFEYILTGSGECNHFDPNYRPKGEKWTMPHLKEQEMAYDYANKYAATHGGVIKNASRKSNLLSFEKVDFDSLFK